MDQNTQLKIEFFELCRRLNTTNLHNQKTEVSFFILTERDESILFAATNKSYKIQLIRQKKAKDWVASGFSGLTCLENEICEQFNRFEVELLQTMNLTKFIKSFIFQHIDQH